MIIVTIGTTEQPFDRLIEAAAQLQTDEPLVVQYGSSAITSGPGRWVDFLGFDEIAELMREARVVVCHAGVGSIMLARQCGHKPIVVPRRLNRHEAVDDHQLPLAERLAGNGLVTLVQDERLLAEAIAAAGTGGPVAVQQTLPGVARLVAEIQTELDRAGVARTSAV